MVEDPHVTPASTFSIHADMADVMQQSRNNGFIIRARLPGDSCIFKTHADYIGRMAGHPRAHLAAGGFWRRHFAIFAIVIPLPQ